MSAFIGTLIGAGVALIFAFVGLKFAGYSIVKTKVKVVEDTSGGSSSPVGEDEPTKPRKTR